MNVYINRCKIATGRSALLFACAAVVGGGVSWPRLLPSLQGDSNYRVAKQPRDPFLLNLESSKDQPGFCH